MQEQTQAERLAEALLKLKTDVTAQDRSDAEEAGICSKTTISKYLNGNVQDNDTAVKLITFFNEKITNRDKAVA